MGLIDSHAHLTFPELRDRVGDLLARCDNTGVDRIISVGIDLEDARNAVALAGRHPGRIYAAGGFHPHEAEKVTESRLSAMADLWDHQSIVAVGEIGLDHHYDLADRETQKSVFRRQLEKASSRTHPVIVHCREAFDDAIPILLDCGYENRPVVFHCFTGTANEALRLAEHGWRMSLTGIVTFPKSTGLQQVAEIYPKTALMIESDSPYLSPVPVRGKRPNEPAYIAHTAHFLAELRGVSYEELAEQTARNTREFFGLDD